MARFRLVVQKIQRFLFFFATLLSSGVSELTNIPGLRDINTAARLLETLGAEVETDGSCFRIDARNIESIEAPYDLV